jgi:large subunit ribosomal protein L1
MPTPKAGTVTDDLASAIKEVKSGRVEFKMDKTGAIAVVVGKRSFESSKLVENTQAALDAVNAARPEGFKGKFIKRMSHKQHYEPEFSVRSKLILRKLKIYETRKRISY